ncbi:hypothetical protein CAC42_6205 [Sphaceloma murrayae]|uniref:Uncharacterized protein n=1 Tax=Sphaceloma murrayae TaxID=2082308 RepID=A0A2K1QTJ1_9PEZI|nr:hypothetical protein CAC42_6205 [Sphaceloma murrayae]
MSQKTYLLSPSLDIHPGGDLRLGAIFLNPFTPEQPISHLPNPPEPITHTEFDRSITRSNGHSLYGNLFASFLATAGANLGGEFARSELRQYDMNTLETIKFRTAVTNEAVTALVASDARVRAAINSGTFGRQPVYMVSGLKVAKGLRWATEVNGSQGGSVGATAPVTESVGLGGEVGGSRSRGEGDAGSTVEDVIIAYQLHQIVEKGWRERRRRAEIGVFKHAAAFLGKDDGKQEDLFEIDDADGDEIAALAEELEVGNLEKKSLESSNGEETVHVFGPST